MKASEWERRIAQVRKEQRALLSKAAVKTKKKSKPTLVERSETIKVSAVAVEDPPAADILEPVLEVVRKAHASKKRIEILINGRRVYQYDGSRA
jgi:hypothetical protein